MPDAPAAPTIQTILDDAGAIQGEVGRSLTTDDATPTVKVLLGAGAQAGDTIHLDDRKDTVGGPGMRIADHQVTASDLAQGFFLTTVSAARGQHGFSAWEETALGARSPFSAEYSVIAAPDGGVQTTPLTDGGKVVGFIDYRNNLDLQKYDSAGNAVGLTLEVNPLSHAYDLAAAPGGGYVFVSYAPSPGGGDVFGDIVAADGSITRQAFPIASQEANAHLVVASNGGFLVSATLEAINAYATSVSGPVLTFFNSNGDRTSQGLVQGGVMVPGAIQSIHADDQGRLIVDWQNAVASGTLVADPTQADLTTPPTPDFTVLDDQGHAVPNGGTTEDTSPTFRIPVTEAGQLFVTLSPTLGSPATQAIAVTSADVARGYVDVPETTVLDGSYTALVTFADPTSSASLTARATFTVQTHTAGQVLQAQPGGSNLQGGPGDDTLVAGNGPDTMTGAGGADHFVFKSVPWRPGHITDFTHGTDKVDLSALLTKSGYAGADPIADGYVKLIDDGHGDSWLYFDSDGRGTADQWGSFLGTLDHLAPSQVTSADFIGAAASPPPPPAGQTLHGQAGGSNLQGGSGDDTLIGGTGSDTMTGAGGADHFAWSELPWVAAKVTDFTHGTDKIDLSGLLASAHYAGADPIADGYVKLIGDGHGGTWLYFDTDGRAAGDQWGTFVATLQGVGPASLSAGDFILH